MRGLGLGSDSAGTVRSGWRWALATVLPLLFAACGDDAGTPDARPGYDASLDATPLTDCEQLQLELQQYADEKLDNDVTKFAGLMLGVDTPACGVSVVAAGLAYVDPETAMTPEHMLPIASISKTFVATRVLQLVEDGDLSLDDTLSNWWPDIPNAESITIRQLLNHTSGVPNYSSIYVCWIDAQSDLEHEWTVEELVACIDGVSALSAPGEEFHYSNTNYVFLGSIVEAVTGNALHEESRTNLLSPLGLDHTFTLWYEEPPGDLAASYQWDVNSSSWLDVTDAAGNYSFGYACGDLASNPGDLLAWVRALFAGTLLQTATLDEMTDCVDTGSETWVTDTFWDTGYGLGIWCAHDISAGDVLGHLGRARTAVSGVWYSPSWDSSVVFQVDHGVIDSTDYRWLYPIASDLFAIVGEHR